MLVSLARKIRVRQAGRSRGQSLVEFALTLPVILFLTLIAIDFGRVYLGYINLQNMTRIAANYAANHPEAWLGAGDAKLQAQYQNQIVADATQTNCQLPISGGKPIIPAPQFTDATGDGDAYGLGDTVSVHLACRFQVITPLIANVIGGSVGVGSSSNFPVKAGMSAVAPTTVPGPGVPPVAAFSGNTTLAPNALTVVGPTVGVEFRDTSGGAPLQWEWDFGDGTPLSHLQDPLVHTFTCAFTSCDFLVSMKATNLMGSGTAQMMVTVIGTSDANFTSDVQSGAAPLTVNFTDASTPGGTAWAWTFGDGQTGTGVTTAHTYAASGIYDVKLVVTYPSPVGNVSVTKTGYISVAVGTCTVPKLIGLKYNNAQAAWTAANFTGIVSRAPLAPNGNFTITAQSQVYTDKIPCSSNVQVSQP